MAVGLRGDAHAHFEAPVSRHLFDDRGDLRGIGRRAEHVQGLHHARCRRLVGHRHARFHRGLRRDGDRRDALRQQLAGRGDRLRQLRQVQREHEEERDQARHFRQPAQQITDATERQARRDDDAQRGAGRETGVAKQVVQMLAIGFERRAPELLAAIHHPERIHDRDRDAPKRIDRCEHADLAMAQVDQRPRHQEADERAARIAHEDLAAVGPTQVDGQVRHERGEQHLQQQHDAERRPAGGGEEQDRTDAHHRHARGEAVDAVHHVEGVHQADDRDDRDRNAEQAKLQVDAVAEQVPRAIQVDAGGADDQPRGGRLDDQARLDAHVVQIVDRAGHDDQRARHEQARDERVHVSEVRQPGDRAQEEAQPTDQGNAALVRLATTRLVDETQALRHGAKRKDREEGDGQGNCTRGHQFCFFHARLSMTGSWGAANHCRPPPFPAACTR